MKNGIVENIRLEEARGNKLSWKKWRPYWYERQCGTVREIYSPTDDAWNFFTHDHGRSQACYGSEAGIFEILDGKKRLCISLKWRNGKDTIPTSQQCGLTNSERNQVEDVKIYYSHLDNNPSKSYVKKLYKYPQPKYLIGALLGAILKRSLEEKEYELPGTGIFNENRYFNVYFKYGKEWPKNISEKLTAINYNPVWMPINILLVKTFQKLYLYYGDNFKVECPTGSGNLLNLFEVSKELSNRLSRIFTLDARGKHPVYESTKKFQTDPNWCDHILFYEYDHGDNGAGLGASHQTGWSGAVVRLIDIYDRLDAD